MKYAQKRVKNVFSSEIMTVELLGDSGETTWRHFGGRRSRRVTDQDSGDLQDVELAT